MSFPKDLHKDYYLDNELPNDTDFIEYCPNDDNLPWQEKVDIGKRIFAMQHGLLNDLNNGQGIFREKGAKQPHYLNSQNNIADIQTKIYKQDNEIREVIKNKKYSTNTKHVYVENKAEYICEDKYYTGYWTSKSKINLDRYIYGQLYAKLVQYGTCEIIGNSSRIYSWVPYLKGFAKRGHLFDFQIINESETTSKLIYWFNSNNIKVQYADYLQAIEYLVTSNLWEDNF